MPCIISWKTETRVGSLTKEFEEIAVSGGKVTFTIRTDDSGRLSYQVGYSGSSPGPMVLIGVYALPQGIPVGSIQLGGIGQPWNPPPVPGCFAVLIASDSQGRFGHQCPSCAGYWRSGPWPSICPYCASMLDGYQFLSEAQARYVSHYCDVLNDALDAAKDGEVVIDMDAVAKAAENNEDIPAFYVAEQSQQCKFQCVACDEFNDILGLFGYCSGCGTRNDLEHFETHTITNIRERLNAGDVPEDCVRDAVASFDTFTSQYAKQLAKRVPMVSARSNRLSVQRFHNLEEIASVLKSWFGIDIGSGISKDEWAATVLMFHRRHVYEHNGGEVDQKYLDDSGDTTVRLKQHIRETKENAHKLLGSLLRMAKNIHRDFHQLFPPLSDPIYAFEEKKARIAKYQDGN